MATISAVQQALADVFWTICKQHQQGCKLKSSDTIELMMMDSDTLFYLWFYGVQWIVCNGRTKDEDKSTMESVQTLIQTWTKIR